MNKRITTVLTLLATSALALAGVFAQPSASAAPVAAPLPPAAARKVDFVREIQPLLKQSCVQCHGHGKAKGDFSLETRESFLEPHDGTPVAVPGNSADSLVVKLVSSSDPDVAMPQKGKRWTPEQVGLLRAWIDQGMPWEPGVTFAKAAPENITPRTVTLSKEAAAAHPLDAVLAEYFKSKSVDAPAAVVDDATFARRVYLDTIGLLPTPAQLTQFVNDKSPEKRSSLVKSLLADDLGYADHWLTFWNDLLRNDYKGTGFIDGGRKQITGWLYGSLASNKPLDKFVSELVSPKADSSGFVHGILWRGNVNASMTPPMQAAQGVAQVFFGVNLKCASCHDSFVSDWTLSDAYSLAAVFSDKPLELVHCDKPTGQMVSARFLYPQIGAIDDKAPRDERLRQFASLITSKQNGRLSRTVVNRLWARLLGRGLVEPLDDMDRPAWSPQILDWLAEDMVAHGYDLRRTIGLILTSRAYQLPSVEPPAADPQAASAYTFRGPQPRRLTAEQFADALSTITGDWAALPASVEFDFSRGADAKASAGAPPAWVWTSEPVELGVQRSAWAVAATKAADAQKRAEEARQALDAGAPPAAASAAAARAKKAADEASAAAAEADALLRSPERSARLAAAPASADKSQLGLVRHRVVFRKRFTLDAVPEEAYAVIAASQRADVQVNGKGIGALVSDGRQTMLDLKPALKKGENVIAIGVDSHTEKPNVPLEVRQVSPWLTHHLNARCGVAFRATVKSAGKTTEIATDETWLVRRAPAENWKAPALDDKAWPAATRLAAEASPADEGPALPDAGGPPEANMVVELGPKLAPLVALPTRVGRIRSALRASDPLQLALDRPNREQITSVRSTLATTIQALEMTNGATLDEKLKRASAKLAAEASRDPARWVHAVYVQALSRPPTDAERKIATEALGSPVTAEAVADLLWAVALQPEFQFVR